jgi:murein DD-endopeptidase MepM/ murein hydrolase activator NlpD
MEPLASHGLALLAALASPSGAPDPPARPPVLSIEASRSEPKQGGLVVLVIRSDRPLEALRVAEPAVGVWLEREPGGSVFRGLAGVDLEAQPGEWRLHLAGVDSAGRRFSDVHALRIVSGRFAVEPLRVDSKFVEPPPSAARRIREERERVAAVWRKPDRERRWSAPFRDPVEAPLRDNFGVRRVFNGQPRSPHNGVDFPAKTGTPVAAPGPGRVALAADLYYSGGTVILDHGGGLFTTYFHLSRIDVKPGRLVAAGGRIGAVGATGRVTGPHLHWGARLEGARINPLDLKSLPEWPLEPGR